MPADPSPDSLLVARATQGERAAWAELYERYADRLHDYATRLTGSRTEAADCVQDAFVLAVQRIGQLRDPDKVRPWLYAIVRSTAHRHYRRVDRWAFGEVPDAAPPGSGDDAVIAGLTAAEVAGLVAAAAAGLTEDDREVLDLSLRHDLAPAEIAAALGVSTRHAAVTTERMRERLGRSITVTLLARRPACPDLAALAAVEAPLSPLTRKRLARHVDGCPTCTAQADREVRPAALLAVAPLPLLLLPRRAFAEIAPRVDEAIASTLDTARRAARPADGGLEWDPDGFPRTRPGRGPAAPWRRAGVVGVSVVALVVAGLVAVQVADDEPRAADRSGAASAVAEVSTPATRPGPPPVTGPDASPPESPGEESDTGSTDVAAGGETPVAAGRSDRTDPTGVADTSPADTGGSPEPSVATRPTTPATGPATTGPAMTPGSSSATTTVPAGPPAPTTAPSAPASTTSPPTTAPATTAAPTTTIDATGPTIGAITASVGSISVVSGGAAACWEPPSYAVLSPTASVVSVPVSDPSGVASVTFTWSTGAGSGSGAMSGSGGAWSTTLAALPPSVAPLGGATEVSFPLSVTVVATDGTGHSSTVTRSAVLTVRNCYVIG